MTRKRIAIVGGAVVALAAGSAGAVAATKQNEAKQREDAVLGTAAKQLDVTPQELRDALRAGQAAQLDQAVKDGRLTQQQADAMKQRMQKDGLVLGGGPGGRHGGPGGPGGGRDAMADVAKALGLSQAELHEQLHDGKTLAQIAKAQGKDLDDVKAAVKKAAIARLDKAVKDGDITKAQRDDMVEHLDEHLDDLGTRRGGPRGPGGPGHGPGGPDGPPRDERGTDDDDTANENGAYAGPQAGASRRD